MRYVGHSLLLFFFLSSRTCEKGNDDDNRVDSNVQAGNKNLTLKKIGLILKYMLMSVFTIYVSNEFF